MSWTWASFDSSVIVATSPWVVRSSRLAMAGSEQKLDTVSRTAGPTSSRVGWMVMASVESREEPAPSAKRAAIQAAVLAATEALLAEGASYSDLNIERIATRAGISRTAFYFYFRDKRELLMRLTEEVNELLYQQADIWFSGAGEPEPEMREALTNIAALYAAHGVLLRAIVEVSTYDEEVAQFWRGMLGRFVEASRRRIELEHEARRGGAAHAQASAFALCWMTERAMYQHLVQAEPFPAGDLVDALVGIWLRSVYGSSLAAPLIPTWKRPPPKLARATPSSAIRASVGADGWTATLMIPTAST